MSESIRVNFGKPIPLFPLPDTVLLPHAILPLHIFEPRYRQMAADCLSGTRTLGMVTVQPDHALEMAGDPPVFPVGCAGEVVASRRLPDGRYNLVLHGTHRFVLERELERPPERLYRVALVRRLEDSSPPEDARRVAQVRARVVELVGELVRRSNPDQSEPPDSELLSELDDATFANALSNALAFATSEKQGLLEAPSVRERLERLAGLLSFRLAEQGAPGSPNSGTLH
jgi:Lon protease-like protein